MQGTALLFSSHDRCHHIHNDYIVQRALRGQANKRILFLPFSSPAEWDQRGSWDGFRWYFDQYAQYGLEYFPFYWSENLQKSDVDQLWNHLATAEVVILGGGSSKTGLFRYKEIGRRFDDEPGKFGRILHERQQKGLLTVGFSAGADQIAEYLFKRTWYSHVDTDAFGLARNTMVFLHHDAPRNYILAEAAGRFPHCMVFGLPNDAALSVAQGKLASGNWWQVIEFVVDTSWDKPEDNWHIKTRSGELIEHLYADGRNWRFRGGDKLVRIQSPDNGFHQAWFTKDGTLHNYWSQQPDPYHYSVEDVLARH